MPISKDVEEKRKQEALNYVVNNIGQVMTGTLLRTGSVPVIPARQGGDGWVYNHETDEWEYREWFRAGNVIGEKPVKPQ